MAGGSEAGTEMLGDGMLGGSMLGGGPASGGGGGAGGGLVGDWFVGEDMLGGGPSGGDGGGGGGGGPGVVGEAGRSDGEAVVAGSLELVTVYAVEVQPAGEATVAGTLGIPQWAGAGSSAGESMFDSDDYVDFSPNLRIGPPIAVPLEEQFDARPDFPHADGDPWSFDHWFTQHGNAATHAWGGTTGAVDVQGGRGRLLARGYNSPNAYARAMARTEILGDIDLVFDQEWVTGFGGEYEFFFHADGTWSSKSATGRPLNGYRVFVSNSYVRLYRRTNGSDTTLGDVTRTYEEGIGQVERVRVRTVGTRIQMKVWNVGDPEPGSWHLDLDGAGRGSGYLQWLAEVNYGGGSTGSIGGSVEVFLDNIAITRVDQPLLAQADGDATVTGNLTLPHVLEGEADGESQVAVDAEVHLLSGGLAACDSTVSGVIGRDRSLVVDEIACDATVDDVHLDSFSYEALIETESLVVGDPEVTYSGIELDGIDTYSDVDVDLTYWIEVGLDEIGCSSEVVASFDVHLLPGGLCAGESEVEAHLWYLDGIVPLGGAPAGESTPTGSIVGFFSVSTDEIACSTELTANLTYWKPLGDAYAEGSSEVVGQFEIYTIPPGPIECASEVTAHLDGDWVYRAEIICEAEVALHVVITTYFLPGPIEGYATVTNKGVWLDPHDLYVDNINGSSSFRSEGRYLVLNLSRGLEAETTTTTTQNDHDHPYTGTRFLDAILGMPVVIGLYQSDRAQGESSIIANLFVNEGGQANCNSRVSGIVNMLTEAHLSGETTGENPFYYYYPIPEYWRPQPPQYVLDYIATSLDAAWADVSTQNSEPVIRVRDAHVPCGTGFLWADFWRRGDLEPQVAQGETYVGQYFEGDSQGRVNVHPTGANTWYRPQGYFVETTGFNTLGLYAKTSTEDDQYNLPYSYPSSHPEWSEFGGNRTVFGDQVWVEVRAGQTWHETIPDPHPDYFHGRCGTRFVSTIDGSNSVDLFWEPKNALYALIDGVAEVVGNFIILRYRTITVLGNIARKADLNALIEGNIAKSPDTRMPFARQPRRKARELEKVRSGNTLYT